MTEHHIQSGTNTWSPPSEPMVPRLSAPRGRVGSISTGALATSQPDAQATQPAAEPLEPVSRLSPTGWSPTAWRFSHPDGSEGT